VHVTGWSFLLGPPGRPCNSDSRGMRLQGALWPKQRWERMGSLPMLNRVRTRAVAGSLGDPNQQASSKLSTGLSGGAPTRQYFCCECIENIDLQGSPRIMPPRGRKPPLASVPEDGEVAEEEQEQEPSSSPDRGLATPPLPPEMRRQYQELESQRKGLTSVQCVWRVGCFAHATALHLGPTPWTSTQGTPSGDNSQWRLELLKSGPPRRRQCLRCGMNAGVSWSSSQNR
jgi:hypothetical protein